MIDYWYRYVDYKTAPPLDEWDNVCGPSGLHIMLRKYPVIKLTPQGARLDVGIGDPRWAKRDCQKRFACPTIEEARESFLARKERQRSIYQARADHVSRVINRFKSRRADNE